MSLTPILREKLRGLKAEEEEKNRLEQISKCVNDLYRSAVHTAKKSRDTMYSYSLPRFSTDKKTGIAIPEPEFHRDNMNDILSNLRTLFPDCSVTYTQFARGQDGNMYDISKMDEKVLAFIDKRHNQDCIVIDWS